MFKLKVHGNKLYIQLKPKGASIGKVLFPEKTRQITRIAEIIAIGEDVKNDGIYKVGDIILVSTYQGIGLNIPAHRLDEDRDRIISSDNILAIVKEE